MAVLILQTEDHVLTEHSNDTRVPNILWLKQNPKDLRKCPSTVTDSIKNADIQLCNSWGKFSKEWSILHASTLANCLKKKVLMIINAVAAVARVADTSHEHIQTYC